MNKIADLIRDYQKKNAALSRFFRTGRVQAIACAALVLALGLTIVPLLRTKAQNKSGAADSGSRKVKSAELENYDIRLDDSAAARQMIANYRMAAGRETSFARAESERFSAAETSLRQRVPSLVVEYNETLHAPEVIGLNVILAGDGERLAARSGKQKSNAETLRKFISDNNELIGLSGEQIGELKSVADYTNPDGVLSYAHLEQSINDIPVFQAEIKAGFNRKGEMFRVINNLAPALDDNSLSGDFGDARIAVGNAFKFVSREMRAADYEFNPSESTDLRAVFGADDRATTAEKMYFPVEAGAARAAWRVLIWSKDNSYYVITDAETGALLWRKNITAHQTQPVTYNVYANSTSMVNAPDSPAPFTPGPVNPNSGTQAPLVSRSSITLIGNEGANSFNNLGWITDGNNTTDGNNVQAGLDRVSPNGVDATVTGSSFRNFTFNYIPGNPSGGDDPLLPEYQKGAVTQLFYLTNRYHDELYKLGFTEAARNFQTDNFSRGGTGNDRISAEAQDNTVGSSCPAAPCYNNANFATPADGGRGRMQMYLWSAPNPDRDGDLDADIVIHELTHGTSGRLIGNGSGLSNLMGGGMGEGWSDFYAHCLLSEPTDSLRGIYTTGGYSTLGLFTATPNANYYYGIRAFPKAIKSFTGGAQNRPHNPLTFADIDSTQVNTSDGAFPAAFTFDTTSVHDIGEVWSSALWEFRARFIRRLGFAEGNRRTLQFVTDAMKLTPNNPTFLQARDAIKQAATVGGTSDDLLDVRIGFAIRGMGDAASFTSTSPARVVESFDPAAPSAAEIGSNAITITNETVSPVNNAPDPGETLTINVPLQNYGSANSGSNVTLTLLSTGGIANPSAAQNYGTLTAGGAAVSRSFTFDVPASTAGGSSITLTFQVQDGSTSFLFTQTYTVAAPSLTGNAPTIVSENYSPANNTPDPGETVTVSVPLQNYGNANSGANVTVTLLNSGGITNPSAAQNYGLIAPATTVSRNFTFTVPVTAVCGSSITLTFQVQDGATSFNFTKTYMLGANTLSNSENFNGVTAPALPANWTSTQSGSGTGWTTSTTSPSSAPNVAFAGNPATVGLSDLESPAWNVTTPAARLDFKINYNTELNYDGAVLEIKVGSGAYQDILAAGGSFTTGGYNLTLNRTDGTTNPLYGRAVWSGNSGGYVSASINLPATANGQTVQFRWRMGSDSSVAATGVRFDDVQLYGGSLCGAPPYLTVNNTADTNDGVCDAANCTLREALDAADGDNIADTITFNIPANSAGCVGTNCTITLTSQLAPAADGGLLTTIDGGSGANVITLRGSNGTGVTFSMMNINGANIAVDNLNITNGRAFQGAAFLITSGTLTLTNSTLHSNTAAFGGAIYNAGTLNLNNITVSGNTALSSVGGGIYNISGGTVSATNITVTKNTASSTNGGGGGTANNGTFNILNSIIADNTGSNGAPDASGSYASQGYNLIGKADGASGFGATSDQTGAIATPLDAGLAALNKNGGKTLTHALLANSPALDKGGSSAAATDQRGLPRLIDLASITNAAGGNGADIGAFEAQSSVPQTYMADVASRPAGDGQIQSNDVVQMLRFFNEIDAPNQTSGESRRADSAPRATGGDGVIDSADVVQTIRYLNEIDALQSFGGALPRAIDETAIFKLDGNGIVNNLLSDNFDKTFAPAVAPELRIENATGSAGNQVTVNVRVDAVGNESQYGFAVLYDTNVLTYTNFAAGGTGAGTFSCNTTATAGRLRCSIGAFPGNQANTNPLIGEIAAGDNQILIKIAFTVAANAQANTATNLAITSQSAADENANAITPTATGGAVSISAPTAAGVSVGGRVIIGTRGLMNAIVTMTDAAGNRRTARTNSFGYYRFENVAAGQSYIVAVQAKNYEFPVQTVNLGEDLLELNFYNRGKNLK